MPILALAIVLCLSACAGPSPTQLIEGRGEVLCDIPAGGGWAQTFVGTNTTDACLLIGGVPRRYPLPILGDHG